MKSILFVCLGNICRSPLAEGIAKEYVKNNNLDIEIDSCGTSSWHVGEAPCDNSIKIAHIQNIDISIQRARQITKDDLNRFETIIALDSSNYENLLKMGCPKNKLSKLGFYGYNSEDVPDPYFFDGFEGFEKVYEMIDICVKRLIDE
ncbi:MAG: low molecular weight protein-tyrosine-phosphatase [Campylobacterota bacterium]|nr:low molecular weight protein-tyrosine-phosphatase [Campylobacterota bacterium]